MARYVAFLRAINVGGHTIEMERLRAHFEKLRFSDVETFIASGNVVFRSESPNAMALEARIEKQLREALEYEVKTFLRTDTEVAEIAQYHPWPEAEIAAAGALNVGFLAQPLTQDNEAKLMALKTDNDDFHVRGREIYWKCLKRQSESKFSNAAFERAVGVPVTFRGMNTITRLVAKYPLAIKRG